MTRVIVWLAIGAVCALSAGVEAGLAVITMSIDAPNEHVVAHIVVAVGFGVAAVIAQQRYLQADNRFQNGGD